MQFDCHFGLHVIAGVPTAAPVFPQEDFLVVAMQMTFCRTILICAMVLEFVIAISYASLGQGARLLHRLQCILKLYTIYAQMYIHIFT